MRRSKRRVGSRKKRRVGNRYVNSMYNRYVDRINIKKPWYKRMFSKKKVKKIPGEVVRNERGIQKPCYKNYGYGNRVYSCKEGEFCATEGEKRGFCVYEFSSKQIKKGRKELAEWNKLKSEMERKRQSTSRLAVLGRNKSKRRRFRK